MLKVIIGDIFKSKAQTLVNTVNCVGVMGQGIALGFKERFPDMYQDYVRRCEAKEVRLGEPYLYRRLVPPWILNFPTKDHWRSVSRLEDIIRGMEYLEAHYRQWGITSLAVPPLGCGRGQLEWRVVGPTLFRHLKRLEVPVVLYAPFGTAHEEMRPTFLEEVPDLGKGSRGRDPSIGPAWVALVEILRQIEEEPHHRPIGRITFQKIAYFATETGIPTGLNYRQGSYGPYAPELKAQITRLVNNGLIQEERLGSMFSVKVGFTFNDAYRAYSEDLARWRSVIDHLADLFMRMRTHQAELAATVHYVAKLAEREHKKIPTEMEVLDKVLAWKQRRRPPLNESEVAATIRNLGVLGWLNVAPSPDLPVREEVLLGA